MVITEQDERLKDLLEARASFVTLIKKENSEAYGDRKWSLQQNWAGPQHGFKDHMLDQRWRHFYEGWKALREKQRLDFIGLQQLTGKVVQQNAVNVSIHSVWDYAKQHASQCSEGYQKSAFSHVAWWIDEYKKQGGVS